jgi:maltose O-acetyltransferase
MRGVKIGRKVQLGPHVFIDEAFPEYVYIGDNVALAPGVWLISHSKVPYAFRNDLESFVEPLIIEDDVWIAARSTVLPGVKIGKGSIITAGSLVISDVPPNTMFGGVPARPIKQLNQN